MKNKRFTDYMILFNQPSGKKTRKIQRHAGSVFFWEIIMIIVSLTATLVGYLITEETVMWFISFFWVIFVLAVSRENREITGMFVSDDKKNLFFRTIPGRNDALKKAMITSEINRFICILVYCVFSSGYSENRLSRIVLSTMVTYTFCVIWVNFKRMNLMAVGVIILFTVGMIIFPLIWFDDLIIDNVRVFPPALWIMHLLAALSVPAAAAAGFLLNRWSYRSLCSAGRTVK